MSDSIENIVAEMRVSVGVLAMMSNTRVAVPRATLTNWADRIESLRQVPEGYVLVPRKITEAMCDACHDVPTGIDGSPPHPQWIWYAMIAAAPKANHAPPTSGSRIHWQAWNREVRMSIDAYKSALAAIDYCLANRRREWSSTDVRLVTEARDDLAAALEATPAQAGAELPDGYLPKESECSELAARYFYRQGYEDARRGGSDGA